ncbi:MAG: hypothetical protein ACXWW2_11205, partial [Candidatus Deferrimicrobiaceae bacterium]
LGNLLRLDPLPDRPGNQQGVIRSHPVDRFQVEVLLLGDARFDPAPLPDQLVLRHFFEHDRLLLQAAGVLSIVLREARRPVGRIRP